MTTICVVGGGDVVVGDGGGGDGDVVVGDGDGGSGECVGDNYLCGRRRNSQPDNS